MTPAFITLPSGLRVNTAHIIHYGQSEHNGQIKIILTDEPAPWLETMALFEMEALLQPQGTPIVNPVWNVSDLKPGKPCCFPYKGSVLHGIFGGFFTDETRDAAMLRFRSGEDVYHMWTDDYVVTKLQ